MQTYPCLVRKFLGFWWFSVGTKEYYTTFFSQPFTMALTYNTSLPSDQLRVWRLISKGQQGMKLRKSLTA